MATGFWSAPEKGKAASCWLDDGVARRPACSPEPCTAGGGDGVLGGRVGDSVMPAADAPASLVLGCPSHSASQPARTSSRRHPVWAMVAGGGNLMLSGGRGEVAMCPIGWRASCGRGTPAWPILADP